MHRDIMAIILHILPTEILLKIIEDEPTPAEQLSLFKTLRATCVNINNKIGRFFGSRHYRHILVDLNEWDFW
jgi:hypothetical protein